MIKTGSIRWSFAPIVFLLSWCVPAGDTALSYVSIAVTLHSLDPFTVSRISPGWTSTECREFRGGMCSVLSAHQGYVADDAYLYFYSEVWAEAGADAGSWAYGRVQGFSPALELYNPGPEWVTVSLSGSWETELVVDLPENGAGSAFFRFTVAHSNRHGGLTSAAHRVHWITEGMEFDGAEISATIPIRPNGTARLQIDPWLKVGESQIPEGSTAGLLGLGGLALVGLSRLRRTVRG